MISRTSDRDEAGGSIGNVRSIWINSSTTHQRYSRSRVDLTEGCSQFTFNPVKACLVHLTNSTDGAVVSSAFEPFPVLGFDFAAIDADEGALVVTEVLTGVEVADLPATADRTAAAGVGAAPGVALPAVPTVVHPGAVLA